MTSPFDEMKTEYEIKQLDSKIANTISQINEMRRKLFGWLSIIALILIAILYVEIQIGIYEEIPKATLLMDSILLGSAMSITLAVFVVQFDNQIASKSEDVTKLLQNSITLNAELTEHNTIQWLEAHGKYRGERR